MTYEWILRTMPRFTIPAIAGLILAAIWAVSPMAPGSAPMLLAVECLVIAGLTASALQRHSGSGDLARNGLSPGQDIETFFHQRPEPAAVLDDVGRLVCANPAFCHLVGQDFGRLKGQRLDKLSGLSSQTDFGFWTEARDSVDQRGRWSRQTWGHGADGRLYPQQMLLRRLTDAQGQPSGYALDAVDISDVVQSERELERSASQDPLTGLFNRRYLEGEATAAMARCAAAERQMGILLLDIDGFKTVNDRHGHAAGDEVLGHVADCLREVAPLGDTIVRLGGDEFVVLSEDLDDPAALSDLARDLRGALSQPFALGDETLVIGASVGASLYPDHGDSLDRLLVHADAEMYRDKNSGRGGVRRQARLPDPRGAQVLDEALREADFTPYFQPIVDLRSRRITGAEALCRWQHPTHGLVNPSGFMPSAEASGTIRDIDRSMIRQVCAQLRDWRHLRRGRLPVSVNVSAVTITEPGFVRFLSECFDRFDLVPDDLVVELTETKVLMTEDPGYRSLTRLHRLGVSIALDDFGTGFSTLALLKDLPFTRLKIDRSFVTRIDRNDRDREIVSNIVCLGRALGTDLVVEGVETEAQACILSEFGDLQAQGYLFGKPMPAAALAACENWCEDTAA